MPVAARWTKVGGCVDFVVGRVLCGGVLPRPFDAAFSALGGAAAAAAPHVPEDDVDIAEWQEKHWDKITSKRMTKTSEFLSS